MALSDSSRLQSTFAFGLLLATPLNAEGIECPGQAITVQNAGDRIEAICTAAAEVKAQLASCNLTVAEPITIEITGSLPRNCFGLYHCDDQLIQLLPLQDYANYLSKNPDGAFGHLEPEVFHNSVLRHEMSHATLGATPCPYEVCPVTREFVAYTMQTWFLSETDRLPFDQHVADAERPMTQDDITVTALMMMPEAFIKNAHAYLSQQDDPCAFIDAIVKGQVVLDLPYR